jgi:hypothetical protein
MTVKDHEEELKKLSPEWQKIIIELVGRLAEKQKEGSVENGKTEENK